MKHSRATIGGGKSPLETATTTCEVTVMADLIIVLNAGSSSLKFTIYADRGENPEVLYDGQIEGILTETRFKAKDGTGKVVEEKTWPRGSALDHEGAIDALFAWGSRVLNSSDRIAAVGHRVVHGGLRVHETHPRQRSDSDGSGRSSSPWRRFISPTTWPPSAPLERETRICRRWPASTPPFTRASLP